MSSRNTAVVAVLEATPTDNGAEISALPAETQWLCAGAAAGEISADWLRSRFRGRLLYRPPKGNNTLRLSRAAREYDLVELDSSVDLTAEMLDDVPADKRLIRINTGVSNATRLRAQFDRAAQVKAQYYSVVCDVTHPGEAIEPLLLLKALRRNDVIAYAAGPHGFWTRLVAPSFGAPMVFGRVGSEMQSDGVPTVSQLIRDYGFPVTPYLKEIYGIVGSPVFHSMSPRLHNAAYRSLSRHALFVPFHVDNFDHFWQSFIQFDGLDALDLTLKGLTVASPHKESALRLSAKRTKKADQAKSSNLYFPNEGGEWTADTTDPDGILSCLGRRSVQLSGRRAAVVGCGGAGRAIAHALACSGADVTLVNRGFERGRFAAGLLALPFQLLSEFRARGYSLLVNATPVGRNDGMTPFSVDDLDQDAILIDLVYGLSETPLARAARRLGCLVIDGHDVLLAQVRCQFRSMCGVEMPLALAQSQLRVEPEMCWVLTA